MSRFARRRPFSEQNAVKPEQPTQGQGRPKRRRPSSRQNAVEPEQLTEGQGRPARREPSSTRHRLSQAIAAAGSAGALVRFWWVVVIGALVAVAVGVVAIDAKREPFQYTASARVLVTSPEAPYFRIGVTTTEFRDAPAGGTQAVSNTDPPDVGTLVRAANLYPLLIQSDPVTAERETTFGRVPGTVEARAVFSVQTPTRVSESTVPVIEVTATSLRPENAVKLADDTVAAFATWMTAEQKAAGVKEDQRILIEPIETARVTAREGGPSYGIPVLLAAAVFLAACGLAVALDSLKRRMQSSAREHGGAVVTPVRPESEASESRRLQGPA